MEILHLSGGFEIQVNGARTLRHTTDAPMFYVGYGEESVDMYRGNYKIEDYVIERIPLGHADIQKTSDGLNLAFAEQLLVEIRLNNGVLTLDFTSLNPRINRFWMRVQANEQESVFGCGEQMSYFNLRGKHFPIWTSEPGVGRNKNTYITWRSDVENKAGGDYYNTNYPQPTYISSRKYYLHVDSTAYADFNFKNPEYHELQFWEVPRQVRIESAESFIALLEKLTAFLGRQPELPDWIYNGLIFGVQGGTERAMELTQKALDRDIPLSAVWCQDWEGKKITSFGKRLRWNWQWDQELYPGLPEKMKELKARGIRFMGYINPYLLYGGNLYAEAKEKGYFATKLDGSEYLVDFGEFECGVVDFTNPDAYNWYKENIKRDLIAFGLDGWMADFGEYLPTDLKLYNGVSPMIEHNRWPALWAKCNYDALVETGKLGEIVYFMRAGGTGSQKYCTLLWAGDQSVDFSLDDGLASVIPAALSAGMSGCGLTHSDIGGYTSLFDNCRTKELFLRWAEMAVFTPVMRTHEGNRPDTNFQFYDDEDAMKRLSRLVHLYRALAPYTKALVAENAKTGTPVQRALFLHYENDARTYDIRYSYLYGPDLLVAPVYIEGAEKRAVYLPDDEWVHLWSGKTYSGGDHEVDAPIGEPPVFYRKNSDHAKLFEELKTI